MKIFNLHFVLCAGSLSRVYNSIILHYKTGKRIAQKHNKHVTITAAKLTVIKAYDCNLSDYKREGSSLITIELGGCE